MQNLSNSHIKPRLIAVIVGTVAALLIAEASLWLLGLPQTGPFQQIFAAYRDSEINPSKKRLALSLMCYDDNPSGSLDIDLRDPNQFDRYKDRFAGDQFQQHWRKTPYAVAVEYNSSGFRDANFTPRMPGTQRIVVVGDSYTYGHGLPQSKCYPRRLESILRQRDADQDIEVINCGRGMAGIDFIERFSRWALPNLQPNVLIYGYYLNDAPSPQDYKGHDQLDTRWLYSEKESNRFSLGARPLRGPRVYEIFLRAFEQRSLTRNTLDGLVQAHQPTNWKATENSIKQINQLAASHDCRFIVIVLPLSYQVGGNYPLAQVHQYIVKTLSSSGIEVIDAQPLMRGYDDDELMLHPHDRHPNTTYAQIVAQALADQLKK